MKIKYKNIQTACVLYIIVWLIAPPLSYDFIYRILAMFAVFVWLFLYLLSPMRAEDYKINRSMKIYTLCVAIYVPILFLFRCIFNNMSVIDAFYYDITTYIMLLVGMIGGIYARAKRHNEIKIFYVCAVVVAVFFSLTSIFRDERFYELTRAAGEYMSKSEEMLVYEAAKSGVGSFGFFCFTAVLTPIVLWNSYLLKGKQRVLSIIAVVVMEFGVFSAGYTLALGISLVGIALCLLYNVKTLIPKMLIVIGIVLVIIFLDTVSVYIYHFLQNLSRGTFYENKVNDIFSFLMEGESSGSFELRAERYRMSLNSLKEYPVIGSYLINGTYAVGYHSAILDTFAGYGWIVGGAWFYIIAIFPTTLVYKNKESKRYRLLITILIMATAMFNQYTMIMATFYLVVPVINCFKKDEMQKINDKRRYE